MLPLAYRALTGAAAPFVAAYLRRRRRQGKEDATRLRERLGYPGLPRPPGPLVWVHAASVGEAVSVLALIDRMLADRPALSALITTGTVAAARLIGPRLPEGACHQFVPVDLPRAVARFLDHWRPDLALWVESELWPNLVLATQRRQVPMALVNARLSARSYAVWQSWPGLAQPVVSAFSVCLAQDELQARRFRRLGAAAAASVGDLKAAAEPLGADPERLGELQRQIGTRPIWLAASTHPGEEEIVAAAHRRLALAHPGLLTIVAPRHPVRGATIAGMLGAQGLVVAQRAAGEPIAADTDIYLADTMGEMGLFYRLAGVALIGGSLVDNGGHNPFEAARLDCAILRGPDMSNNAAMAAALAVADAGEIVTDAASLAAAVARLLTDPDLRDRRAAAAGGVAACGGDALEAVLLRLAPWLDRIAPAVEIAPPAHCRALDAARADARS